MSARKIYLVSLGVKVVFIVFALVMLFGAVLFHVDKRIRFADMLIDNALMPISADFDLSASALKNSKGIDISWSQFAGQWVLLNFWATWCHPCREEMPSLDRLSRHFKDRLLVVAISVDEHWDSVSQFFLQQPPPFVLAWDREKKLAHYLQTEKFPETFLVNPQGQVMARFVGPRDWSSDAAIKYFARLIN